MAPPNPRFSHHVPTEIAIWGWCAKLWVGYGYGVQQPSKSWGGEFILGFTQSPTDNLTGWWFQPLWKTLPFIAVYAEAQGLRANPAPNFFAPAQGLSLSVWDSSHLLETWLVVPAVQRCGHQQLAVYHQATANSRKQPHFPIAKPEGFDMLRGTLIPWLTR